MEPLGPLGRTGCLLLLQIGHKVHGSKFTLGVAALEGAAVLLQEVFDLHDILPATLRSATSPRQDNRLQTTKNYNNLRLRMPASSSK